MEPLHVAFLTLAALLTGALLPLIFQARATLRAAQRALDATGLDVRRDPDAFVAGFNALGQQARAAGAEALILGGAVLAGYAPRLRAGVRYIDCVAAAVAAITPARLSGGGEHRGG